MGNAVCWIYLVYSCYIWGFLRLCIPTTLFFRLWQFLSFYVFSGSYHSSDCLLETSLLFSRFVVSALPTYPGLFFFYCSLDLRLELHSEHAQGAGSEWRGSRCRFSTRGIGGSCGPGEVILGRDPAGGS